MDADDFLHRHGKQVVRVMIAQVVLDRKGQAADVIQRLDILRLDAERVQSFFIHGHTLVNIGHRLLQTLQLQRLHFGTTHRFDFRLVNHGFFLFSTVLPS